MLAANISTASDSTDQLKPLVDMVTGHLKAHLVKRACRSHWPRPGSVY